MLDFDRFRENMVGFEDFFRGINQLPPNNKVNYPPYNIRKVSENKYVIEIAIAGFSKTDIELTLDNGTLVVSGETTNEIPSEDFIYKGISNRAFSRKFTLADSIEIKNADLFNGLLKIWLEKVIPEDKKPRKIEINETEETPKKVSKKDVA